MKKMFIVDSPNYVLSGDIQYPDPVNCFPIIEKYPTDYYKIVQTL